MVDTEYFGGIAKHLWIWSIHMFPAITSILLYLQSRLRIVLTSWRNFPYMILHRFFATQTMWFLRSKTVCDKLLFINSSFRSDQPRVQSRSILPQGAFLLDTTSFSHSPGLAGSLAQELA